MIHKNHENQRRYKKIADEQKCRRYIFCGAYYDDQKKRYIRIWKDAKYIRKQVNRKVRRYKGEIKNGGNYRKISEYWWLLD